MADAMRRRRFKEINEDGMELVHYEPIGKEWATRFLGRYLY